MGALEIICEQMRKQHSGGESRAREAETKKRDKQQKKRGREQGRQGTVHTRTTTCLVLGPSLLVLVLLGDALQLEHVLLGELCDAGLQLQQPLGLGLQLGQPRLVLTLLGLGPLRQLPLHLMRHLLSRLQTQTGDL